MAVLKNFPPPSEGIHHSEPNTSAFYMGKNLGKGTLYIAESVFCWISGTGEGFSLNYSDINIHAVSKDLNNFPSECLFLQIDGRIKIDDDAEGELSNAMNTLSMGDAEEETAEMYFVPDNKNMLDVMYRALSDCQAMNSTPEDELSDDGFIYAAESNEEDRETDDENGDAESDMEDEDQFEDAQD